VTAVSGDARRALDICRRAAQIAQSRIEEQSNQGEIKEKLVTIHDVDKAIKAMFSSLSVITLKGLD